MAISLSDIYKYPTLRPYEGLEGKIPVSEGTTFIGIEIELENYQYTTTPSTWNMVEDHSLKLDGKELVTIPIRFKYLEIELDRLIEGTRHFSTSSRCSVHVHVNVRDFTEDELKVFTILYLIFEKSFFNFSGNRWNNNYCTPLFFNPEIIKEFFTRHCAFSTHYDTYWYKYSALNLCPIWGGESKRFGTAEFRHMEGNLDKERIMNWCNLIVSLKVAAKKMSLLSLLDHVKTMNTTSGYTWLVAEVFSKWQNLLTNQRTFKKDIESCITRTKYILFDTEGNYIFNKEYTKEVKPTTTTTKAGDIGFQHYQNLMKQYAQQPNTYQLYANTPIPKIAPTPTPKPDIPKWTLDLAEEVKQDKTPPKYFVNANGQVEKIPKGLYINALGQLTKLPPNQIINDDEPF